MIREIWLTGENYDSLKLSRSLRERHDHTSSSLENRYTIIYYMVLRVYSCERKISPTCF